MSWRHALDSSNIFQDLEGLDDFGSSLEARISHVWTLSIMPLGPQTVTNKSSPMVVL